MLIKIPISVASNWKQLQHYTPKLKTLFSLWGVWCSGTSLLSMILWCAQFKTLCLTIQIYIAGYDSSSLPPLPPSPNSLSHTHVDAKLMAENWCKASECTHFNLPTTTAAKETSRLLRKLLFVYGVYKLLTVYNLRYTTSEWQYVSTIMIIHSSGFYHHFGIAVK